MPTRRFAPSHSTKHDETVQVAGYPWREGYVLLFTFHDFLQVQLHFPFRLGKLEAARLIMLEDGVHYRSRLVY